MSAGAKDPTSSFFNFRRGGFSSFTHGHVDVPGDDISHMAALPPFHQSKIRRDACAKTVLPKKLPRLSGLAHDRDVAVVVVPDGGASSLNRVPLGLGHAECGTPDPPGPVCIDHWTKVPWGVISGSSAPAITRAHRAHPRPGRWG